jgi:hypothetical protein
MAMMLLAESPTLTLPRPLPFPPPLAGEGRVGVQRGREGRGRKTGVL